MAVQPINDPAELESITAAELVARVRPLLAKAAQLGRYTLLRRLEPNIPSAVSELAAQWRTSPRLREGPVPFGDYLAARLWPKLIEIDRAHYPELYDPNRTYRPERQFGPLDEHMLSAGTQMSYPTEDTRPRTPRERFTQPLIDMRIAPASAANLLAAADNVASGISTTGYRVARDLGLTPEEARRRPATYTLLEFLDRDV